METLDRKHLNHLEIQRLLEAAKIDRHGHRDRALILLMCRHGPRVSEACGLKLAQVDLEARQLPVHHLKNGLSTTHPLQPDEVHALRRWLTRGPYQVILTCS